MGISIVVPKAFSQFAENENLLLYEQLMDLLHADSPGAGPLSGRKLVAGQGLDEKQISHAWVGISKGLTAEFEYWHANRGKQLATKPLVHKHRVENTLISTPERGEDGNFVAELVLHEQNELMLDHLTGQHVQGMVLTEACRQMFSPPNLTEPTPSVGLPLAVSSATLHVPSSTYTEAPPPTHEATLSARREAARHEYAFNSTIH